MCSISLPRLATAVKEGKDFTLPLLPTPYSTYTTIIMYLEGGDCLHMYMGHRKTRGLKKLTNQRRVLDKVLLLCTSIQVHLVYLKTYIQDNI